QAITMPVSTVAHFTKVSRQVMNDNARLQQFIGERMRSGVELRAEQDLINGTGASGQMSGLLKAGNFTSFTPATGDDRVDSLRRAKLALEAADYFCGLYIMNPADVAAIELQRDNEERFLIGRPLEASMPQIWGTPIYWSTKIAPGQFVALDLAAVMVGIREEIDLRFSESDEDDFQRNLISVRAEARMGLGVLQPGGVRAGALLI
ncbi:MAG: phage major capsid protein, partial [Burkholderiales bacterium]|nr:phage major capsid protein [Burkholderiales bacterium]